MKQKKGTPASTAILIVCLLLLLISLWKLYGYYREYKEGEDEYETLTQYVEPVEEEKETENGDKKDVCPITVDFASLRAINADVIAWVYIVGTGVNYPIVQGEDNEYYLHHTFERKENFSGAVFMDVACRPDFSSDNNILFGHNLRTGEMFGTLKKLYDTNYTPEADWTEHPMIWIVTPDAAMKYRIFAAREINVRQDTDVYMTDFAQREEYERWLLQQKEASMFETDTDVSSLKPVLTLSTCTSDNENGRFIVQAIHI